MGKGGQSEEDLLNLYPWRIDGNSEGKNRQNLSNENITSLWEKNNFLLV